MEDEHVTDFQTIRAVAGPIETADEEMLGYIRAMADGRVFDVGMDPEAVLTGEESAEEILSTAIGLEKESVVYYVALKEVVTDESTRQQVRKIINEEMSHIALLSGQRESLRG